MCGACGCRPWLGKIDPAPRLPCSWVWAGVGLGRENSPRPAFPEVGVRARVCWSWPKKIDPTRPPPPLRQPTVSLKYSTRASVLVQKDRRPHHLHLNARFSLHKRAVRKFDLSCCCLVGVGAAHPSPIPPDNNEVVRRSGPDFWFLLFVGSLRGGTLTQARPSEGRLPLRLLRGCVSGRSAARMVLLEARSLGSVCLWLWGCPSAVVLSAK